MIDLIVTKNGRVGHVTLNRPKALNALTHAMCLDLEVAMTPKQAADMIVTMLKDEGMVWSHVSGRSIRDYV